MYDEHNQRMHRHTLAAGVVVYGWWSPGTHLNANVPLKIQRVPLKLCRRTWTLYLDYKVFAAN